MTTKHLISALTSLGALSGSELAVVAAAAQALATAQQNSLSRASITPPLNHADSSQIDRGTRASAMGSAGCATRTLPAIQRDPVDRDPVRLDAIRPGPDHRDRGDIRLGGGGRGRLLDDIVPVDPELFASAAYRRRLGASVPGLLYVAGSDGLLALAERLDMPLWKAGITEGATLDLRMSMLSGARYAGVYKSTDGWIHDNGFDHWRATHLPLQERRGRLSPVRPALRAIAYERPVSLAHCVLDRAVAAALRPTSLATYMASVAGQDACRFSGLDPSAFERYTPGTLGRPRRRPQRARELVLLGPRADADRIAAAVEAIIAEHVLGRGPA